MLCERCGRNQANTYLKQIINGSVKEIHLCEECAEQLGYNMLSNLNPFEDMGINVGNLLGGFFSQSLPKQALSQPHACSFCGSTFEDFVHSARAGCANCYHEFYSQLLPSIQRIHGKTKHVGKIPASASKSLRLNRELENLKQQLKAAVDAQEYEKAATLRDKIRDIERQVQDK